MDPKLKRRMLQLLIHLAAALLAAPTLAAPPTATTTSAETLEDSPGVIFELAGTDPEDGNNLTAIVTDETPGKGELYQVEADNVSQGTLINPIQQGPVTVTNPDRLVMFVPNPNANGPFQFFYLVEDSEGLTDLSQVLIDIVSVNDAPLTFGPASTLGRNDSALTRVSLQFGDIDSANLTLVITALPARGRLFFGDPPESEVTLENSSVAVGPSLAVLSFEKEFPGDLSDFGIPYTTFMWKISDGDLESSEDTHTIDLLQLDQVPDPGPFQSVIWVMDAADVLIEFAPSDPDGPNDDLLLRIDRVPDFGTLHRVSFGSIQETRLSAPTFIPADCFLGVCEMPLFALVYRAEPGVELAGVPPTGFDFRIDDSSPENDHLVPTQTITFLFSEVSVPVLPLAGRVVLALALIATCARRETLAR